MRCGVAANAVVQSKSADRCAGLSQVVILLMLHVVRCVLLLVFYGRVGVLTQFGKSSWWSRVESAEVGKAKWKSEKSGGVGKVGKVE